MVIAEPAGQRPSRRKGVVAVIALFVVAAAVAGVALVASPSDTPVRQPDTRSAPAPLLRLHAETDPARGGRVVDAAGREVLLRGVNVNALGDYWHGNRFPPTFPFGKRDPDMIRSVGWNVVRLVLSWSRVEPAPGRYDDGYLDAVAGIIEKLARRDIYTIVDMHQDAWSATLAARPGERCVAPLTPNLGWDGAPPWATFDDGQPHCHQLSRETSPAVSRAWQAFFSDRPGPGGVGIQTRFVDMWRHVARRFASNPAVAAFDVLNEPNAFGQPALSQLAAVHARAFQAIRGGERDGDGFGHIVMFEPSILYSGTGIATPAPFPNDGNVAYAPHIYTGTFPSQTPPDERWFQTAEANAHALGGIPVINGEWGGRPRSRQTIDSAFFTEYQALSDAYRFSAQFWLYKSSCGDPHEIDQNASQAAGLYIVDCRTNKVVGPRDDLIRLLARPYPRTVNGVITSLSFDPHRTRFVLSYRPGPPSAGPTVIAVPRRRFTHGYRTTVTGATVASLRRADILRVRACPHASTVTVTVTAGKGSTGHRCRVNKRR